MLVRILIYLRVVKWIFTYFLWYRIFRSGMEVPVEIMGSAGAKADELRHELEEISLARPTMLCLTMTYFGSDKGNGWHNYTILYSHLFQHLRGQPITLLEVGLGTNNPGLASTMGIHGSPGASLRGWRRYFKYGSIFGADIDRDILFMDSRIKTFYCDQTDPSIVASLWSQAELAEGVDILIDDGLHEYYAGETFMDGSLSHVKVGGFYAIEDIPNADREAWLSKLASLQTHFHDTWSFLLINLPNRNNPYDNNILVGRRRG